jgi:hypothetical protein
MAFNLASISKTKQMRAPRILLAGVPKVGKSTFAAGAPNPIVIRTEDGLDGVDVSAFPLAETYEDVLSAIDTLTDEAHDFETVVLDSTDWLEPLLWAYVCKKNKWDNIEAAGYGKGYVAAADEWRNLIERLEILRAKRNMAVILISHVSIKRIEDPMTEGYDSYVLKTNAKASAILEEYADVVGFAAHRVAVRKTDAGFGQKQNKALKTGDRVLHLEPSPAYPSGTRFGFEDCDLTWEALANQFPA